MPNYANTKMYKLVGSGMVYYGHTTQKLSARLRGHRAEAKTAKSGTSKLIVDGGDFEIIWLEDYPCKHVDEARARERWWIENNDCINKQLPGRTKKEYEESTKERSKTRSKVYAEANKEHIKEYLDDYYQKNKEKMKANAKRIRDWNKSWGGNKDMKGLNHIDV